MKKYYEIENTEFTFDNLEEAKNFFKTMLEEKSSYNYKINMNNSYCLLENCEDQETGNCNSNEILKNITIKEFNDMSYEEKEKYFNHE